MITIHTTDKNGEVSKKQFKMTVCPNLVLEEFHSKNLKWDVQYENMPPLLKKRWQGIEIYWRLRRAIEQRRPVIIRNEIFQLKKIPSIQEIHLLIQKIIAKIQEEKSAFWLNEEDTDCVTIIRK